MSQTSNTRYYTSADLARDLGQSRRTAQRVLREQLGPANGWRRREWGEQYTLFRELSREESPRRYGLRRIRKPRKPEPAPQLELF